jgi:hypothetical protein
MRLLVSRAGRFAEEAASQGEGEVRAVLRTSAYVRFAGERYACIGDASLGDGPLNASVESFALPTLGERVELDVQNARRWTAPPLPPDALRNAARARVPREGLGGLVVDAHNALSGHAQPALDALERWLVGNALDDDAAMLVGLGPGFTPAGDNYLCGMLVALNQFQRSAQASALWRWLKPRLVRTSPISAAHVSAAAIGEGAQALHLCLVALCNGGLAWDAVLPLLSGAHSTASWDALAGVVAVAKSAAA